MNLRDLGLGNDVSEKTPKAQATKGKNRTGLQQIKAPVLKGLYQESM